MPKNMLDQQLLLMGCADSSMDRALTRLRHKDEPPVIFWLRRGRLDLGGCIKLLICCRLSLRIGLSANLCGRTAPIS